MKQILNEIISLQRSVRSTGRMDRTNLCATVGAEQSPVSSVTSSPTSGRKCVPLCAGCVTVSTVGER